MTHEKERVLLTMEMDEDYFYEMEAVAIPEILIKNERYQKGEEEIAKIIEGNETLMKLIDWNTPMALTEEDSMQLLRYIDLERQQNDIWKLALFQYAQKLVLKQITSVLK